MAFDLAKALGAVPEQNTEKDREQILYIPITKLASDEDNFYRLTGIEDLASNISLVGLQQPIRVREDGDSFRVISGHRRLAALRLLNFEEKAWENVPCIVEKDSGSAAMRELRLIYANSSTRVLSAYEIERQAERIRDLLYQLQKEGVDFPGRMRHHVAEVCRISDTKLGKLEAIRNRLAAPIYNNFWAAGKITEAAAYALSQYDQDVQTEALQNLIERGARLGVTRWTEKEVRDEAERLKSKRWKTLAGAGGCRIDIDRDLPEQEEPETEEDEIVPETNTAHEAEPKKDFEDVPEPKWFSGTPVRDGRYYCRVIFDDHGGHLFNILKYAGGKWYFDFSERTLEIDSTSKVALWWPVPEVGQ